MSVLLPVFAMALITFVVVPLILTTCKSSVKQGVVNIEYYELFRGGVEPPTSVLLTSRHRSNLFETPILFYIVCLMAFSLHLESVLVLGLAWSYVAMRLVHSVIHLTYNHVLHQLTVYSISQATLIIVWILIFYRSY